MRRRSVFGVVACCTAVAVTWGSWASAVPNCNTGKLCGNSCISRDKECHVGSGDGGGEEVDGAVVAGVLLGTVAVGGLIWLAVALSGPSRSSSRAATQPSWAVEEEEDDEDEEEDEASPQAPASSWSPGWPDYPASCERSLPADQLTPEWVVGRALEKGWKITPATPPATPGVVAGAWEIVAPDGTVGMLLIARAVDRDFGPGAIDGLWADVHRDDAWVADIHRATSDGPPILVAVRSSSAGLRWMVKAMPFECPRPAAGDPRSEWVPRVDGAVWEGGGAMTLEWGW